MISICFYKLLFSVIVLFFVILERLSFFVNLNVLEQIQLLVQFIWEFFLKDGGSFILGYIIERREEGKDNWIRCNMKFVFELIYKVRQFVLYYL